ncbi:MAG: fluoride efflux transporter CrcB [Solirubrobacteraceae bacterium]
MSDAIVWLGVGVIGGLASIARFAIDRVISSRYGRRFPLGTLTVNVAGAALLGLVTGLALRGDALLLAGTAGLGSYTTFSTWMFETHRLAEDGETLLLAANVLASIGLGCAAVALGRWIA